MLTAKALYSGDLFVLQEYYRRPFERFDEYTRHLVPPKNILEDPEFERIYNSVPIEHLESDVPYATVLEEVGFQAIRLGKLSYAAKCFEMINNTEGYFDVFTQVGEDLINLGDIMGGGKAWVIASAIRDPVLKVQYKAIERHRNCLQKPFNCIDKIKPDNWIKSGITYLLNDIKMPQVQDLAPQRAAELFRFLCLFRDYNFDELLDNLTRAADYVLSKSSFTKEDYQRVQDMILGFDSSNQSLDFNLADLALEHPAGALLVCPLRYEDEYYLFPILVKNKPLFKVVELHKALTFRASLPESNQRE